MKGRNGLWVSLGRFRADFRTFSLPVAVTGGAAIYQGLWPLGPNGAALVAGVGGVWAAAAIGVGRWGSQSRASREGLYGLLDDTTVLLDEETHALREDLGQLQGVMGNAVESLQESFTALNEQVQSQQTLLTDTIASLADETGSEAQGDGEKVNVQQVVQQTSDLLEYLIDLLVNISRDAIRAVENVDNIASKMDGIIDMLGGIRGIAEKTDILSINASISAASAGEGSEAFAVIAQEIRDLSLRSNDFSNQIERQIRETQETLDQARESVGDMASQDMNDAIQSKGNVDSMLTFLKQLNAKVESTLEEVSGGADRIEQSVSTAVRALQFEDIANQILGYASQQLEQMEELNRLLKQHLGELDTLGGMDGRGHAQRLAEIRAEIKEVRESWRATRRKPVSQDSMEEGELEMF